MKNKKLWITAAALVVVAIGVTGAVLRSTRTDAPTYRHATLERGDIESSISATGTLGAVTTVQVGTQVSGQVSAIYADFNDHVKARPPPAEHLPTRQLSHPRACASARVPDLCLLESPYLSVPVPSCPLLSGASIGANSQRRRVLRCPADASDDGRRRAWIRLKGRCSTD